MALSDRNKERSKAISISLKHAADNGDIDEVSRYVKIFHDEKLDYVSVASEHFYTPLLAAVRGYINLFSGASPPDKNVRRDYLNIIRLLLDDSIFSKQINATDFHTEHDHARCSALHYAIYAMTDRKISDGGKEAAKNLAILLRERNANSNTLGRQQKYILEEIIDHLIKINQAASAPLIYRRPRVVPKMPSKSRSSKKRSQIQQEIDMEEEEGRIREQELRQQRRLNLMPASSDSVDHDSDSDSDISPPSLDSASSDGGQQPPLGAVAKGVSGTTEQKGISTATEPTVISSGLADKGISKTAKQPKSKRHKKGKKQQPQTEMESAVSRDKKDEGPIAELRNKVNHLLELITQENKTDQSRRCASYDLLQLIDKVIASKSAESRKVLVECLKIPKFFSEQGIAYALNVKRMELAARTWVYSQIYNVKSKHIEDRFAIAEKTMREIVKTIPSGLTGEFLNQLPHGVRNIAAYFFAVVRSEAHTSKSEQNDTFMNEYAELFQPDINHYFYELFERNLQSLKAFNEINIKERIVEIRSKGVIQDPSSQYQYAVCLYNGFGLEKDVDKAIRIYTIAANKGDPRAHYQIGKHLYKAMLQKKWQLIKQRAGGEKDSLGEKKSLSLTEQVELRREQRKAVEFIQKAADQGLPEAQLFLVEISDEINLDKMKSLNLLKKAAEKNSKAQIYLANRYLQGSDELPSDFKEAYTWYKRASEHGLDSGLYEDISHFHKDSRLPRDEKAQKAWILMEAEHGVADAQYEVGLEIYTNSKSKEEDQLAYQWFCLADENGSEIGEYMRGKCLKDGIGVERDLKLAVELLESATDEFDCAKTELGECYEFGIGVERNVQAAFLLYQEAAEGGDENGIFKLGQCYQYGTGVERDDTKAAELYKKAADLGHVDAQLAFAYALRNGVGIAADKKEAAKWFYKAAQSGNPEARIEYASELQTGESVEKDEKTAITIYRTLAENGFANAQYKLALCLESGIGESQDEKAAYNWYKAASQQLPDAQVRMGLCLELGRGVEQDLKSALSCYQLAAEQNSPNAMLHLGRCCKNGICMPTDVKAAFEWFSKAAEQNIPQAQYELGLCFESGLGVEKNGKQALELFRQAAAKGVVEAQIKVGGERVVGSGLSLYDRRPAEKGEKQKVVKISQNTSPPR